MFDHIDYVMVTVSDMKRSVQFYRDQLGLILRFESPEWTEFETGRTVLALHGGGTPASSTPSLAAKAGTASIGFEVDNLERKYADLRDKGVVFAMPPSDRGEEAIKLAICLDPDGLPISMAERRR